MAQPANDAFTRFEHEGRQEVVLPADSHIVSGRKP